MKLGACLAALATTILMSTTAQAAVIFKQTFESGLGANEAVSGRFSVAGGKLGHVEGARDNEYSYYQLALDLTDFASAEMAFDYDIVSELNYDGFNVLGSLDTTFTAATELLTPTNSGFYGPMYGGFARLGPIAASGDKEGHVVFDLSDFAGQVVNLRFQYQSDRFAFRSGVVIDNLTVTGAKMASAVPEPATWAMLILGFGMAGAALRQRRSGMAA
jgi:hypothetical protein